MPSGGIYTEADFEQPEIGDDLPVADHVCSQGYRVGPSDVDLFGNLDRVIDLDAQVANSASIRGDRVQLQQVVLNLILNAVEAMGTVEGERELSISTEQTQIAGGVLVAVRDSGAGIDPEHLERVFETFYTTKSSGTGMGLSICRSIIRATVVSFGRRRMNLAARYFSSRCPA